MGVHSSQGLTDERNRKFVTLFDLPGRYRNESALEVVVMQCTDWNPLTDLPFPWNTNSQ